MKEGGEVVGGCGGGGVWRLLLRARAHYVGRCDDVLLLDPAALENHTMQIGAMRLSGRHDIKIVWCADR